MLYFLLILIVLVVVTLLSIYTIKKRGKKVRAKRAALISLLSPEVEKAFADISSYYNFEHYITESERVALASKYSDLFQQIDRILGSKKLENFTAHESFDRFHKAMSDTEGFKRINNDRFIKDQLSNYKNYFDTVLSHPMDEQQREAVVSLEDNVLVISSAGSGKTMTAVCKVRYLIDVQRVAPEKILLITFTNKAAESLSKRLGERKLKCKTFHKLALDIITEATGTRPTITSADFSVQVYNKLLNENQKFYSAVGDYVMWSRYKMKDQFEYNSYQDYITDRKKYGIQSYFNDMDGKPVFCKSDEESQICDFLGSKGISFRYEEKYEYPTADMEYRQYIPDFSIYIPGPDGQTKRIYLEHYAINEAGNCPPWFEAEEKQQYLEGIKCKRRLHKDKETILLETSSAGFHRGDVFSVLTQQLLDQGVKFSDERAQRLSRELMVQEENIINMLSAFNFLMKSRGANIEDIRRRVFHVRDRQIIEEIVTPFVSTYADMAQKTNEIDFTDAIIKATEFCNNGHRPDYDYILVDEFQDISVDRYRFLQSLRRQNPLTKLFCIGDDWQSIYRFAGSDMALFKSFSDYFGFTKHCLMETTYRFGEPTISESSKFILANPEQSNKSVQAFSAGKETKLDFLSTKNREDVVSIIKKIADQIPSDKEIILLGRYSFDVNTLNKTSLTVSKNKNGVYVEYGSRHMKFMTVHQSKGLESDYVIMLNCNGGTLGFPADIADSPVLKYVLSAQDTFAFGEERRVFYVGITRARLHTWVLYNRDNPSPFVKEFLEGTVSQKTEGTTSKADLCPKCHNGRRIVCRKGKAVNGNPYTVFICSNRKYGCDYQETVFFNINTPWRKRKK